MRCSVEEGIKGVKGTCFLRPSDAEAGYYLPYSGSDNLDPHVDFMCSKSMHDFLWDVYCTKELYPTPTDTVIDVGSFVGGFSVAAAHHGCRKIYALEPDAKNFKCLERNIYTYKLEERITCVNAGLYKSNTKVTPNAEAGGLYSEFDFSSTDKGSTLTFYSLQQFIEKYYICPENLFLKISVTDVKQITPMIIEGFGTVRPKTLVFDLHKKHHPKTRKLVKDILGKTYNFHETDQALFCSTKNILNKTVWTCFTNTPDSEPYKLDKNRIQSWSELNEPTWLVNELSTVHKNFVPDYEKFLDSCKHKRSSQAELDLLKLMILAKCGGVWVDSNLKPSVALDKFYFKITKATGFSAYRAGSVAGICMSFLALDSANHYIISTWLHEFGNKFINDSDSTDLSAVSVFKDLYNSDSKFKNLIDSSTLLAVEELSELGMGYMYKEL